MPPVAGAAKTSDRVPMMVPATVQPAPAGLMSEAFAKDAIIAWFRGEFAAANAIIDALCNHLTQIEGGRSDYESVFTAIHQRRLNWIPILQMQKYFSIADVTLELRRVAAAKVKNREEDGVIGKKIEDVSISPKMKEKSREVSEDESVEFKENGGGGGGGEEVADEDSNRDDSPESEITDTGSQEVQQVPESVEICSNHEDCEARCDQIKITKGFVAKESVKGHTVNVVRGLKLYEDVFNGIELSKLTDFVNELRSAGQSGELSGETFILYNQQMKGNKREMIQLGVPIFGQIKQEATSKLHKCNIEPIPALLQAVIDHLIQWNLISENRKPNSCIINFFDEGEYSQPFLKPPHLDQPIATLLLSESTMAFGHTIVNDGEGNYTGPLMLSLKEGSLLVMRGNSADMARHVICSSPTKRISITFFKVRTHTNENRMSAVPPLTVAMAMWQPGGANPYALQNGTIQGHEETTTTNVVPKWGVIRTPMVMVAPMRPMVLAPKKMPRGGTGVFLPWSVGSRKPAKHLPPRAQKGRLLALPPPPAAAVVESPTSEPPTDTGISV